MKMKKMLGLLLACIMVVTTLSACGTKKDDNTNNTGDTTNQGTESTENTEGSEASTEGTTPGDVVTLKWVMVGNGMPTNYDAWLKQINPYLEEKIGVNIEMEVVPWGDWDNRRSVIINSGEYFDILFTDQGRYDTEVKLGAFMDITDIIKTQTPDLYASLPEDYWTATAIDGKFYSVPTYKDSSLTNWLVWDQAIIDKYNVDAEKLTTLESLTDTLRTIKDGEGTAPFYLNKNGVNGPLADPYDSMSTGNRWIGVKYNDESRKVINVLEDEDFLKQLDVIHQWYKEGIINADAPSVDEAQQYKMVSIAQGWSQAAKTTWGPNMGMDDAVAYRFSDTMVSNTTVRGSLNAIYSGCKNPEKALEFLQLVNLDSKVRDWFYYGVEGENFKYVDENNVEKINHEWNMAGYTQGSFFTVTKQAIDTSNQWDEVKELNQSATPSVLLGFNLDTSKIETEMVNCRAVYEKYRSELMTGSKEPRAMAKTITEEMNKAGLQTIITEMQAQVDAWAANQ